MERNKFVQFIIKQIKTVTIGKYTLKIYFLQNYKQWKLLNGITL